MILSPNHVRTFQHCSNLSKMRKTMQPRCRPTAAAVQACTIFSRLPRPHCKRGLCAAGAECIWQGVSHPAPQQAARLAAERAAREGHHSSVNEQGTAMEETDKAGRHKLGEPLQCCLARLLVVFRQVMLGDVVIVSLCDGVSGWTQWNTWNTVPVYMHCIIQHYT